VLDIARVLLDAGADVNATSESYGGGSTALGLVSTSAHPRARGVQIALIDVLLGYGARIDGEETLPSLVRNALSNGCPEAAVALASRGEGVNTLYAACGAGELGRAQRLFDAATPEQREAALIVAAQQGHEDIVTDLLDHGVNLAANHGMTALHNAGAGGHTGLMALLLARGADLEARNEYGGTVLSSTLWFAQHVTDAEFLSRDMLRCVEWLLNVGAKTDDYPDMALAIARVRERATRLTDEHDANLLDGH
jgi:ankyrin repeat protein